MEFGPLGNASAVTVKMRLYSALPTKLKELLHILTPSFYHYHVRVMKSDVPPQQVSITTYNEWNYRHTRTLCSQDKELVRPQVPLNPGTSEIVFR